ncbi:MAG: flavin reductase family protein [Gammaproteobacteria bacterium]
MNSVTSLSLEPPLYIVNLDKNSDTLPALQSTGVFCINVLADSQQDLSNRFAKKGDNKFEGVAYHPGVGNVPCLDGALMCIECRVHEIFDGGDHKIVVGKVEDIKHSDPDTTKPLLYYRGRYADIA